MSRRKPRDLDAEERQLWSRVIQTTEPLHRQARLVVPSLETETPKLQQRRRIEPFAIKGKQTGPSTASSISNSIAQQLRDQPARMDAKAFKRMKAGKLKPEARLDLHGMVLAEAQPRLVRFVLDAYDRQLRLVLVITGKGKHRDEGGPIPTRTGVLKHQVPHWLNQFPLAPCILQINLASQKHGGDGAYYVYLRRQR